MAEMAALFSRSEPAAPTEASRASAVPDTAPPAPAPQVERAPPGPGVRSPAPTAPDLDAFAERAAIREEAGEPREEAERASAREAGFATPAALFSAAAERWATMLAAEAARWEDDPRGREHIEAALAFTRGGWAEKAAALGWPEVALFGVHPVAPWHRFDAMGAAFTLHPVAAVTRDSITHRAHDNRTQTRWRTQIANGGVPVWEVAP